MAGSDHSPSKLQCRFPSCLCTQKTLGYSSIQELHPHNSHVLITGEFGTWEPAHTAITLVPSVQVITETISHRPVLGKASSPELHIHQALGTWDTGSSWEVEESAAEAPKHSTALRSAGGSSAGTGCMLSTAAVCCSQGRGSSHSNAQSSVGGLGLPPCCTTSSSRGGSHGSTSWFPPLMPTAFT